MYCTAEVRGDGFVRIPFLVRLCHTKGLTKGLSKLLKKAGELSINKELPPTSLFDKHVLLIDFCGRVF